MAQLDEDGLVLLLEVDAMARQDEGGPLSAHPPCVFSEEILIAFSQPLVDGHRLVVGHHLVADRRLVALVAFPTC